MSRVNLADYLFIKYAAEELQGDTSFGTFINPEKTRILKDKLILVYDKINKDITRLPDFQRINEDLKGDLALIAFNDIINDLVVNVEGSSLKEGFSFAVRMIKALNQLQNDLRFHQIEKAKKAQLSHAIKNISDTIWKESKRILNIHDLRGLELEYPELKGILGKIMPTWNYGPLKNPARKPLGQRQRGESISQMIARLEQENKDEKK